MEIPNSYPVKRFAKIRFTNNEPCLTSFSRDLSFDLNPLQIRGENKVPINLQGWNKSLLYVY